MRTAKSSPFLYLSFIFICLSVSYGKAQQKYWVNFTKKNTLNFDPYKFFDAKTIENRKLSGMPLTDWYDLPVDENYISQVSAIADSAGYSSRWLNGIAVYATNSEINRISKLPFVNSIDPMGLLSHPAEDVSKRTDSIDPENRVCEQVYGLDGEQFAYHHLTGKGIRIAILDVGFVNADKHPAFEYLRSHNGILLTHDFLHHKDNVFDYGAHGLAVLSCIAGKYEGFNIGLAPDAEFLLARTEREATEYKDEEDAWVAAAEWAEQHGAQIISCSLGYTYQRYFYKDMNGKTSVAARGAAAAARKGLLVCIAAGNEGSNNWQFISTPADCDSVLTVGGYDPATKFHINFSSFGPTSDKRMKPNVIASGKAWVATPKKYGYEFGTSFSTPLMAGFAACTWQYMHGKSNIEVLHKIESLGNLYPYFDYAHGYGTPQAGYLFEKRPVSDTAYRIYQEDGKLKIAFSPKYFRDSLQKKNQLKNTYLYIKLMDPDGNIKLYDVINVENQNFDLYTINKYLTEDRLKKIPSDGNKTEYPAGWTVTSYFDNYITNFKF
jgi:serine protease AprX